MTVMIPYPMDATFSYDAKTQIMVAEASTIGFRGFERIYPDDVIQGVALLNPKTGGVVRCHVANCKRDADGDVLVWILKVVPEDVRRYPGTQAMEVHIIND